MKKKIVIIITLISFIFSLFSKVDTYASPKTKKYVESSITNYLKSGVIHIDSDDEFFYSNSFIIYGDNDNMEKRAYFSFRNAELVGILFTVPDGEALCSSFSWTINSDTSLLPDESSKYALVSEDESLWLVSDSFKVCILGRDDCLDSSPGTIRYQYIQKNTFESPIKPKISKSATYGFLPVRFVSNGFNPHNSDHGICWAASTASLIMYHKPSFNLTAESICYKLADNYPFPSGQNYFDSNYAVKACNLYGLTVNSANSGASYSTVKNCINSNKPIYAEIFSPRYGHAVVICGHNMASDGTYSYTFMDPNSSTYVTVNLTNSSSTSFTYVTSYTTYTSWNRRIW